MSLSDLEANIQRTADSEVKVLQRVTRLEKQGARLGGLVFNEDTEPSHKMVLVRVLEHMHPGKRASRRMEAKIQNGTNLFERPVTRRPGT